MAADLPLTQAFRTFFSSAFKQNVCDNRLKEVPEKLTV